MASGKNPIRVGSIIHLKNGAPDGGYLDVRGWVTDKPVIQVYYDSNIQAFVSTNESKNRSMGSGSWLVLSANGKNNDAPLFIGDKIHLLNLHTGAGYLDSFEWVKNLDPFSSYENNPMTIGVFTADVPKRGGGDTGTWSITSAENKANGAALMEGDTIYLENGFPNAGLLHTYGKVTNHEMFTEYDGQKLFVFTGPKTESGKGSPKWTVTLNTSVENLYYIQNQWGDSTAPWHDGGVFKIGGRSRHPVAALNFNSSDGGDHLTGTVTYENATPVTFEAVRLRPNVYEVKTGQNSTDKPLEPDGEWHLGFRDSQNVVAMNIKSDGDGRPFNGTITYAGELPIRLKGTRLLEMQSDISKIYYDVHYYELLKRRTNKLEGVIDMTYRLISDSFQEISGKPLEEAIQKIYGTDAANNSPANYDNNLNQFLDEVQPDQPQSALDELDFNFQIKQLLNLYTLSKTLNSFFRDSLQELMKRSSEAQRLKKNTAPLHQIREGFRHTANDHEIIQQAAVQRRWNYHSATEYCMSEQAVELMIMDKLAIKSVAPFQHLLPGHPDRLAIITYLSEKTHIHNLSYTNQFILVGVSYDRVPPADSLFEEQTYIGKNFHASELMAIPHEVGHYVYQHGRFPDGESFTELSQKFKDNPYYRWCEEIFADVYGCIVAGPLSPLGMQALLVSIDKHRAWKDDEDHPTPALRVFILADILRVIGKIVFEVTRRPDFNLSKMTNKLDEDWTKILEQWGYVRVEEGSGRPHRIYLPDSSHVSLDKTINVERVLETVRPIIGEFASRLLREAKSKDRLQNNNDVYSTKIPWISQDNDNTKPYNDEMAKLSGRKFAGTSMERKSLFDVNVSEANLEDLTPEERLQWYLDNWDNRGPHGWGGH